MSDEFRSQNHQNANIDEAVEEALEGSLRAEQWRGLINALDARRERIMRDLDVATPDERPFLEKKLEEVEGQIQTLAEEENITRFVEDTVRFSYQVHKLSEG